jgi:Neuraminidase (sialidase)
MNKVNFTAKKQTIPYLSSSGFLSVIFILSLLSLPSCALLSHKNPVQKIIDTGLKTIHTLDIYPENNTIHALFSGIDSNTQQLTLKYMNSLDAGKTWSASIAVNQGLPPVKRSKRGNDSRVAAYGNKVMAVWQTTGGEPWTGKIAVALSKDFGQTWQQIASPVSDQYAKIDQGYFDLSADNQGRFHIAWLDDREEAGNTQGLRYARFSGGLWELHQGLEITACTCCWASITTDKNDNIHVLYRDDNPRDMRTISSFDNGQSWQAAKTAGSFGWEFIGCPHQGGGLTSTQVDEKTILHSVIWNGKTDNRGIYYSQPELNKDKIAVLLPIGDNSSSSGDIAALDSDHLRIVYTAGDFESKSVMTKASADGGQSWSNELRLTGDGAEPSHPRIVATSNGFRFFWTEWQENGGAVAIISELE